VVSAQRTNPRESCPKARTERSAAVSHSKSAKADVFVHRASRVCRVRQERRSTETDCARRWITVRQQMPDPIVFASRFVYPSRETIQQGSTEHGSNGIHVTSNDSLSMSLVIHELPGHVRAIYSIFGHALAGGSLFQLSPDTSIETRPCSKSQWAPLHGVHHTSSRCVD
jgi:hypothetical protein